MIDEADLERWNDLAGTPSCSDTEEVEDNIGRILVDGDTYHHESLLATCPPVCIQHQPEKVVLDRGCCFINPLHEHTYIG